MGASREVLEEPESKKKGGFLGSGESQEGTVRYSKTRYPEEKGTHWGRPVVSSTPLMRQIPISFLGVIDGLPWAYPYSFSKASRYNRITPILLRLRYRDTFTYSLWTAKIQTDSKSDSNEIQELLADRNFIARLRARKIGPRSTRLAQKVREARRAEGRAFRNFSSRRCPLSYRVSTARRNFCPPGHVQPRN
ncbi:hypothetical protein V1477_005010, partial [Vespula maculifrons]